MDSTILLHALVFIGQIVGVSLFMGIISSIYMKNPKKGIIFVILYILLMIYPLYLGFNYSVVMGVAMLCIYIILGLTLFFYIKKKRYKEKTAI